MSVYTVHRSLKNKEIKCKSWTVESDRSYLKKHSSDNILLLGKWADVMKTPKRYNFEILDEKATDSEDQKNVNGHKINVKRWTKQ